MQLNLFHNPAYHPLLVVGTIEDIETSVIQQLIHLNYPVRAWVTNPDQVQQMFGNQVEIYSPKSSNLLDITPQALVGIKTIIWFGISSPLLQSQELEELLNLADQFLEPNHTKPIFDFAHQKTVNIWGALNDGVMGGVSNSQLFLAHNQAIFSGIVSTENNGGFASVRTQNLEPPLNLGDYLGIELQVVGDGKRYKFIMRCAGQWDGVAYVHAFDTIYDYPMTIQIPFTNLRPLFRARTVKDADSFDSSKIYSMQLMLSKFEYDGILNPKFDAGPFQITIKHIKAYGAPTKSQFIAVLPKQISNGEFANNTAELVELMQASELPHTILQIPSYENHRRSLELTSKKLLALCEEAINCPEAVNQSWIVN